MKYHVAKIEVWDGRSCQILDFQMAQTQESLGSVIREYVAAHKLRLVYWCKE